MRFVWLTVCAIGLLAKKNVVYEDNYELRYSNKRLHALVHDDEPLFVALPISKLEVFVVPFGYSNTAIAICERSFLTDFRALILKNHYDLNFVKCSLSLGYIFYIYKKLFFGFINLQIVLIWVTTNAYFYI